MFSIQITQAIITAFIVMLVVKVKSIRNKGELEQLNAYRDINVFRESVHIDGAELTLVAKKRYFCGHGFFYSYEIYQMKTGQLVNVEYEISRITNRPCSDLRVRLTTPAEAMREFQDLPDQYMMLQQAQ